MSWGVSDFLEDIVLDHLLRNQAYTPAVTVYMSLHDGHPGETGANEASGGPGPYARQAISWNAAAAGSMDNSAAIEFAGMPAGTFTHFGIWDAAAAGNILWWGQLTEATAIRPTATGLASSDVFTSYAHGLADDDRVEVTAFPGSPLPTGISEETIYFVVTSAADTFQLSATQAGGAINITTDGEAILAQIDAKTTNLGDNVQINAGDLVVTID